MKTFAQIREMAVTRKGEEAIAAYVPDPLQTPLASLTDDRLLSEFSKRVFQSGFNWKVVENKWPGFETAFHGFDIGRNAMMSDEDLDRHLKNTGIVRHATKILSAIMQFSCQIWRANTVLPRSLLGIGRCLIRLACLI
jgi:3-methyladenine DNA glycosylase Tag